jgi:hypothetical protein
LPASAAQIRSSLGSGSSSSNAAARSTMPGMQYPHWEALSCITARCTGCSRPPANPSIVVTDLPTTSPTAIRQASAGAPSTRTVQAPHSPSPQPGFAPVKPRSARRNASRLGDPGPVVS